MMKVNQLILNLITEAEFSAQEVGKVIGQLQEVQDQLIHHELTGNKLWQDENAEVRQHFKEKEITK